MTYFITFILIIVIICIFINSLKKTSFFNPSYKINGVIGEEKVKRKLAKLNSNMYKVINDVIFESDNRTVQIDHIVVSIYGIFVIETKNYGGKLYGSEKSTYWKQYIGKERHEFYNPIKQNWAHIYALKVILENNIKNYKWGTYHSIIAFDSRADLNLRDIQSNVHIVSIDNLLYTIGHFEEVCLSIEKVEIIEKVIVQNNNLSKDYKEKHIENIKAKKNHINYCEKYDICPKCGGKLILRKSKYGEFLGCSNFPKCTFTMNLR